MSYGLRLTGSAIAVLLTGLLSVLTQNRAFAQGVVVVDASEGLYLTLVENEVHVSVENQVALVTTRQLFRNTGAAATSMKYAFPMPDDGSATSLRWQIGNSWREAAFDAAPQDTTLPGGGGGFIDPDLLTFLGPTPLYFDFEVGLDPDSVVAVEMAYVQMLPYEFGNVSFCYPNDYVLIQPGTIEYQSFQFDLASLRTIEYVGLQSHTATTQDISEYAASLTYQSENEAASDNYLVEYSLSLSELGLFGFSTLLADTLAPDRGEGGFFVFVAEPDPSENTEVIDKVFTLIVDRSGSMSGDKIIQARDAARFVVENLNPGDRFNIIDFSSTVRSFQPGHVEFNEANQTQALSYIGTLQASGLTNISGAFATAIPQFAATTDGTANIIVFFTDGQATTGITDTNGILASVRDAMTQNETNPIVFTFGIGPEVNRQLLTQLAVENRGLSEFLGDDQLESRITDFYLRIRNPVVLGTEVSFDPPIISGVYPDPLPSLYKGQQMIVSGRFASAAPVSVTLSGEAFGAPVEYQYELALADTTNRRFSFLPKVWAKLRIEKLLIDYYRQGETTPEAVALRDEIVATSLAFGIISPFTSLRTPTDPGGGGTTEVEDEAARPGISAGAFELAGNYPNPFRDHTTVRFEVYASAHAVALVRIYDVLGRLVRVLVVPIPGPGVYEVVWDGMSNAGQPVPSASYVYTVTLDNTVLGGVMVKVG